MNLPIRLRLTACYVALLALVVAGVGGFVTWRLRADLTGQLDRVLSPAAVQIAHDYRQEGDAELRDSAGTVLKGERAAAQLLMPDGTVETAYGDAVASRPMLSAGQLASALAAGGRVSTSRLGTPPQAFRVASVRVRRRGRTGLVVVAESLAPVQRAVRRVMLLLASGGAVALIAIAAGGWWLARRALRPVQAMAATAAAIGADRLDERVPMPRAHDELAELALTLNTMLERIAGALAQQRRLVADASHELRTPLTAMGAEIDVSLHADDLGAPARRVLLSVREEVDRLGRLVEDLLLLAAADDGRLSLRREPVALMALAREGVRDLEPFARRRDVAVVVGGDADITVAADPDALSRVVRNLVENAIEFSPRGRPVRVTVAAPAIVEVADEGPGIPDALRERVFDRFFRLDPSRSRSTGGTGLGLAIAREIAEAHGGRLTVAEGDRGARLRLTLR